MEERIEEGDCTHWVIGWSEYLGRPASGRGWWPIAQKDECSMGQGRMKLTSAAHWSFTELSYTPACPPQSV
ncbi:uncharacterized [Tachysurus ichikawai]